MPTKTEAIKAFLTNFTHSDLAALYNYEMELQVEAAPDNGEPVDGEYQGRRWRGWRDPVTGEMWKSMRIPYTPDREDCTYEDKPMNWNLAAHAVGIGMTGWNWVKKQSLWVAFDFDAITGHSDKHARKLNDSELNQVKQSLMDIPWVTIRKSTSGKGLHVYVFLEPVETITHTEHAALARAILGQMSGIAGVDFQAKVDACGHIMWVWHRKMKDTDGLQMIKQGERLSEIPPHWRDHLKVIKKERTKNSPFFVGDIKQPGAEDLFEQLTGQRPIIKLDEDHMRLLDFVRDRSRGHSWWDSDHHMLVTHTTILKEAHDELQLKGSFSTVATGRDRGADHNCFAFPLRRGAWAIRRYSPGVAESPTWEQDGQGWTRCFLNRDPDLGSACRAFEGKEHPAGGYVFDTAEQAQKAANALGANLDLPPELINQKARLKQHPKDGRLIAEIEYTELKTAGKSKMDSWIPEKGNWKKIFKSKVGSPLEVETENLDDMIRHVVSESNFDMGWFVKSDNAWRNEPIQHVRPALSSMGLKDSEVKMIIGSSIFRPWRLVNKPFQLEYPGDREWNRDAVQLRFTPIQSDILTYPNWSKIMNHIGRGLDLAIKENQWCKQNGITSGADYLKCWIASLFKEPNEPLPYLFLWSKEQNTGKSILHEALQLLMTHSGYVRADTSLTSPSSFNGELQYAILCVLEETDLKKNQVAYNRIKDWVTSRSLPLHIKGKTPVMIPNTTHWIHCANSHLACPIFPGDTRITMVRVEPLAEGEMIPKKELLQLLIKEAPDFLSAILGLEIPPSNDRLNVPVIVTSDKLKTEESNLDMLDLFLKEKTFRVNGEFIKYGDLYDSFKEFMLENGLGNELTGRWAKTKFGHALPPYHPKGRMKGPDSNFRVGNISFENKPAKMPELINIGKDYIDYSSPVETNGTTTERAR